MAKMEAHDLLFGAELSQRIKEIKEIARTGSSCSAGKRIMNNSGPHLGRRGTTSVGEPTSDRPGNREQRQQQTRLATDQLQRKAESGVQLAKPEQLQENTTLKIMEVGSWNGQRLGKHPIEKAEKARRAAQLFRACQLKSHLPFWKTLTADRITLAHTEGV